MPKYRKKPVIIEAERVATLLWQAKESWQSLPQWVRDAYERGELLLLPDSILVKTLEGEHLGRSSDLLIRGVKGELYPCKPDIFAQTYEYVGD